MLRVRLHQQSEVNGVARGLQDRQGDSRTEKLTKTVTKQPDRFPVHFRFSKSYILFLFEKHYY
jgi:hypothetical protein